MGGPGLVFETWVFRQDRSLRRTPGLKSETWATHSKSGGCSLIFDRAQRSGEIRGPFLEMFFDRGVMGVGPP